MQKLNLTIDVSKISKDKFETRTYTDKEGKEVSVTELKLVAVEKKEARKITEGQNDNGTWVLNETHFIAYPSKQDEETVFVGNATQFTSEDTGTQSKADADYDAIDSPF
jgi:hypothetical protein